MKIHVPTLEEIQSRAYQIYLARGCKHGHDMDDWLQAEYELIHLPLRKIAELEAIAIEKGKAKQLRLLHLARTAMTAKKQYSELLYAFGQTSATSSTAEMSPPA